MITITKAQYKIHLIFELIAVLIVVPFLLNFLYNNWNKLDIVYKIFFTSLIILTLIVDGYLIYKWLLTNINNNINNNVNNNVSNNINNNVNNNVSNNNLKSNNIMSNSNSINKAEILIRQSARYAHAARQDKDILIALLHANYGSGYLFAAKDIFPEKELIALFPSYNKYKEFTREIISIQDEVNRRAVKECPSIVKNKDIVTLMGGESN